MAMPRSWKVGGPYGPEAFTIASAAAFQLMDDQQRPYAEKGMYAHLEA